MILERKTTMLVSHFHKVERQDSVGELPAPSNDENGRSKLGKVCCHASSPPVVFGAIVRLLVIFSCVVVGIFFSSTDVLFIWKSMQRFPRSLSIQGDPVLLKTKSEEANLLNTKFSPEADAESGLHSVIDGGPKGPLLPLGVKDNA
jgi:hypothetical protein